MNTQRIVRQAFIFIAVALFVLDFVPSSAEAPDIMQGGSDQPGPPTPQQPLQRAPRLFILI